MSNHLQKDLQKIILTDHARQRWMERTGRNAEQLNQWLEHHADIKHTPKWVKGISNKLKNHSAVVGSVWIPTDGNKNLELKVCLPLVQDRSKLVATTAITQKGSGVRYS